MKIRITKAGELEIDGRMKHCPFDQPVEHMSKIPCGGWCAKFYIYIGPVRSEAQLCGDGIVSCENQDFTDERPKL